MTEHGDELLLAALAGLLPEQRPEPARARALRERLLGEAGRMRTRVTRAGEGEWQPFVPGIRIKTLRRDEAAGTQTSLWRIKPGATIPPHPHSLEEECLVLEGSILHDGVEYFPGDYLLAPSGERHKAFLSPRGALLMLRGEMIPDADVVLRLLARPGPG